MNVIYKNDNHFYNTLMGLENTMVVLAETTFNDLKA